MIKLTRPIARDNKLWQGHPDVTLFNDCVYIIYREAPRHLASGGTTIKLISGEITPAGHWQTIDTKTIYESQHRLNCPRLSVIDNCLTIVCDEIQSGSSFITAENDRNQTHIIMWHSADGDVWTEPIHTNIRGIVPDRLRKFKDKYLIAVHTKEHGEAIEGKDQNFASSYDREQKSGQLVQKVWTADVDRPDVEWQEHLIADQKGLHLCEGSIHEHRNELFCLMRENSGEGKPGYYAISTNGTDWIGLWETRLFGCHRPVWGRLESGSILITYREQSSVMSPECWARNTFAALIPGGENIPQKAIILPLDHDRSIKPDGGYTGWVQLKDGKIFVVNYITNDAPNPYIQGYLINESDF